jgi:hypothetical protein
MLHGLGLDKKDIIGCVDGEIKADLYLEERTKRGKGGHGEVRIHDRGNTRYLADHS